MDEIYTRMMQLMHQSLKGLKSENSVKQSFLSQKNQEHKRRLDDCIDDKASTTLLNGDIEVKVLRTPSSKKLGPGAYEFHEQPHKSHNIMEIMQQQEKIKERSESVKKRSHSKKDNEPFSNIKLSRKSFNGGSTANLQSQPEKVEESTKPRLQINIKRLTLGKQTTRSGNTTNSSCKNSLFQLVQGACPFEEIDPKEEKENRKYPKNPLDASYELLMNRQQAFGESKKVIEKYRKIVEQSQSMLNKTGDFVPASTAEETSPNLIMDHIATEDDTMAKTGRKL